MLWGASVADHRFQRSAGKRSGITTEKPFGNEIEGRSQVVLTDVADTVEWIMPTLMRMLVPNSSRVIRFKPKRPGPEAKRQAMLATRAVNHIIMEKNNGFSFFHDWFKTALIEKNGIGKIYFEERLDPKRTTYRGLTQVELEHLLEDTGLAVVENDERVEVLGGQPTVLFDIVVQNRKVRGEIKVEGIAPEEFLIARRAIECNDETAFTGHQKKVTVSDLLAMGFDKEVVMTAPRDDTPEYSLEREERHFEDDTFPINYGERVDPASTELWVTECYVRVDKDGDGYSELRKVTVVGNDAVTLLGDEEVNHNPFVSITPCPMPFKFHGQSIYDLVGDLQKIRSVLLRAMMDNLFLANNPRTEVVENQVNIDDLLTSRPGNVVRVRAPGMMREVQTPAFSPMALGMMELLENVKENRTGITRYNQGSDAESLNQTASGMDAIMTAAAARVELIAKIMGQTGIRDLAAKAYQLLKESPMAPLEIQISQEEWLTVDPNEFNEDLDVEIVVGLGVGAAKERVQHIQMIMDLQSQAVDRGYGDYLVTAENVYNSTEELVDAINMTMPNQFFTNPTGRKPPEPKIPENVQVEQIRNETEKAKIEVDSVKAQTAAAKEKALVEHRADDLEQNRELEVLRIQTDADTRIRVAEIAADAQLESARIGAEAAAKRSAETSKSNGATAPA